MRSKLFKYMGEKDPLNDKSVTHGMCKPCFEIQINEVNKNDNLNKRPVC